MDADGRTARSDNETYYWLALNLVPGIGSVRFSQLLKIFHTPQAVFQASARDLARVPRLPQKTVSALLAFNGFREVEAELDRVHRRGTKLITLHDPSYPSRLKEIHDPPPLLWVDGGLSPADHTAVAIVGSRGATEYGREVSFRLAAGLASAGVSVVSGMALGIDAAAHRGALSVGGRTLAVLGCGVDVVYPAPNRDLYREIPRRGAVLSEFSLGTRPEPGYFPVRNRVISGLSLGVVVVEAGERSGALITAREALEQNRDVFAVPGRVSSEKNRGSHALLKQGARLVETAQDILEEIAPQLEPGAPGPEPAEDPRLSELTEEQRRLWGALGEDPQHVDQLGRRLNLTPARLAPLLLEMELSGFIRQLPGMRYTKASQG